jgi:hypothetical protein
MSFSIAELQAQVGIVEPDDMQGLAQAIGRNDGAVDWPAGASCSTCICCSRMGEPVRTQQAARRVPRPHAVYSLPHYCMFPWYGKPHAAPRQCRGSIHRLHVHDPHPLACPCWPAHTSPAVTHLLRAHGSEDEASHSYQHPMGQPQACADPQHLLHHSAHNVSNTSFSTMA